MSTLPLCGTLDRVMELHAHATGNFICSSTRMDFVLHAELRRFLRGRTQRPLCMQQKEFRVVWTDDEVGASIRARWAEGGCPAATFAEFEAMCWAWWRSDPLVMNADGHVGFHDKLCALRTRPRPIQLEAYDINLLQQMAAKVGASAFATKQQLVEAIFRGEFENDLRTKSCRTGSVPMTREVKKKKPKQPKEPKGDPRAPFRPPKKMAPAGPAAEPPAPPTNVVELDEDD